MYYIYTVFVFIHWPLHATLHSPLRHGPLPLALFLSPPPSLSLSISLPLPLSLSLISSHLMKRTDRSVVRG